MTPEILILSGEYDFSTDLICDRLRSDNVPYLRLNREHLGREWQVALDPVGATLGCVDIQDSHGPENLIQTPFLEGGLNERGAPDLEGSPVGADGAALARQA